MQSDDVSPRSINQAAASTEPHPFSSLEIADDERRDNQPLINRRKSAVFFLFGICWMHYSVLEMSSCCGRLQFCCCNGNREPIARTVIFEANLPTQTEPAQRFPANVVRNQKYSLISFLPLVLFEQFRFFFNLYFLVVAATQFVPELKVGLTFTYVAPLVFVLAVTLAKEAVDDFKRYRRDVEANSQLFERLVPPSAEYDHELGLEDIGSEHEDIETLLVPSSKLKVGDLVLLHPDQRVPADMILLRTRDKNGTVFIRTDQLDGETDWKLRHAVPSTQKIPLHSFFDVIGGRLVAEAPHKAIYNFAGSYTHIENGSDDSAEVEGLSLENTMWANTVVATGTVIGCVIYTGKETRSVMNSNEAPSKIGLVDLELNSISKVLFGLMCVLSIVLLAMKGFHGFWYIYLFRYILLFSSIIPISLRVNLDMAKTLYSYQIMRDDKIPKTVVRTSTIPEELGRISYLFSDKTGTLTQNVMEFKKLQLKPPLCFDRENFPMIRQSLARSFRKESFAVGSDSDEHDESIGTHLDDEVSIFERRRQDEADAALQRCVFAMALCHNVTPVEGDEGPTFMAASPDEVALVEFAKNLNLVLEHREQKKIRLRSPEGDALDYEVLNIFPFTSESKRMGIIVRSKATGDIVFYLKGAESVMRTKVEASDWLDEEVEAMAREGLRTLVFGQRLLSTSEYEDFRSKYQKATSVIRNRDAQVRAVVQTLEQGLDLVGLSGVEDKLQPGVKNTLETLRNAGVRIWMLTGDKAETATCIGRSARLVDRNQEVFSITVKSKRDAARRLDTFGTKHNACLLVDGTSLAIMLDHLERQFIELACQAPSVICCRCSPTQKAEVVELMKLYTGKRCCSIGDGGNDVSMIQAAHVGIGIVGKEGKQASLAADFSVNQFSYIQRLMLWHGRNAYKRSARMSQFVMHRGLIISIVQAVFSALFYFAAIPIYTGWLMVGYATLYTQLPVCALVLDEDVDESLVSLYPELYVELQKGRPLSYKTFFIWVLKSVYQGGAIMLLAMFLFEEKFINIVAITFTALILSELLNVAFEIQKWRPVMVFAEVMSFVLYFISMFALTQYFDIQFIFTLDFVWKSLLITTVSCVPVSVGMYLQRKYAPTTASKVH